MQERAPQSEETRILLARYLDGELDDESRKRVDEILSGNEDAREELSKLKVLRSALQNTPDKTLKYNRVSDTLWNRISDQLEADQAQSPARFDIEFISAYYDGEIPKHDAEFKRFEGQLYNNDEANRQLADIGAVSDMIRQFGYRLEESCTLDIASHVMALYVREEDAETADLPQASASVETISAFVDHELSQKEIIEANRLLEGDTASKLTLQGFTRLSESIQAYSERLQAQAPDLWPQVEAALGRDNVVALAEARSRSKVTPLRRLTVTAAAIAILFIVAAPILQGPGGQPQTAAFSHKAKYQELATVPGSYPTTARASFDAEIIPVGGSADALGNASPPMAAPRGLDAPLEPSSEDLLLNMSQADKRRYDPEDVPSTEEFLFSDMEQNRVQPGQMMVGRE